MVLPGQAGKERVNTLNKLAYSFYYKDTVASRQYAEEAIHLSREIVFLDGQAEAFRNLGYIQFYKGDYPRALQDYQHALTLFEETDNRYKVGRENGRNRQRYSTY